VEFDDNSLNLYFLQDPIEGYFYGVMSDVRSFAVIPSEDSEGKFELWVHELGHALGLLHTFPGNGLNLLLPPIDNTFYCKNPEELYSNNLPLCEQFGDKICDTGIDPWTLSLDGDSERDGSKWVDFLTCSQTPDLIPSILDGCNDSTTPWDIPVRNYMTYYGGCRNEFTPCQYGRIHESMELASYLLLDCGQDPYANIQLCVEPDITISTITTWSNETRYFCPGQRIIITNTGHLILDNTTLSWTDFEVPNELCPLLFNSRLWDGVYIEGRGSTVLFNGSYISLGGITLKNSSIIEYSKAGIQGLKGFGKVSISNSTMRHNHTQLALRDPWPFSYSIGNGEGVSSNLPSFTNGTNFCGYSIFNPYPSVQLINSTLEIGSSELSFLPRAETQILVDGGDLFITNCSIINPDAVTSLSSPITAIKAGRGRLSFLNGSKIDNFNVGLVKVADVYNNCSERGLYMVNSNILNTEIAIHTTTQIVGVRHNIIEGDIISEGLSYSNWYANTFKRGLQIPSQSSGIITIQSPEESCLFQENFFADCSFDFYGDNLKSYSLCNTWKDMDEGYAVVGSDLGGSTIDFPTSWGSGLKSSGNIHLDGENPPIMFSEDPITNYFDPNEDEEIFEYEWLFIGDDGNPSSCLHDAFPIAPLLSDSTFTEVTINFSAENTKWLQLDAIKSQLEIDLASATPTERVLLLAQISQTKMEMAEVVRKVLSTISSSDESIELMWVDRANPDIIFISELIALWYNQDFDEAQTILNSISDNDAEVFLEAVQYLSSCKDRNVAMESLPDAELDTLVSIAIESFGNYTNILRNYLNLMYNQQIFWPVKENGLIPRSSRNSEENSKHKMESLFVVQPNPNEGCFTLNSIGSNSQLLIVQVYDSSGRIISVENIDSGDLLCVNSQKGVYFLRLFSIDGREFETLRVIIN
jgi:hypothetical protein